MAKWLSFRWRKWLLTRLLQKRPPPDFIPGGDARNDCITIDSYREDGIRYYIVSIDGNDIQYWNWPQGEAKVEATLPLSDLLTQRLEIRVFRRGAFHRTGSLWGAYRHSFLGGIDWFIFRRDLYDRGLGEYASRMRVLDAAMQQRERQVRDGRANQDLSISQVAKDLYGEMLGNSAHAEEYVGIVRMKLASFIDTGEIISSDPPGLANRFKISPLAYRTLAEFSDAERRHMDNVAIQRWMVFITVVLALVAAVQLYATISARCPSSCESTVSRSED